MPSLFIHSTGTNPFLWGAFVEDGDLAPANLGYPPNAPLPRGSPSTLEDEVAHLAGQAETLRGPIDLYAHSYGGLLALALALRLGATVRSLFLIEPVLFGALAQGDHVDAAAAAEARGFRDHPWFLSDLERAGTDPWLEVFIDYWNRPGTWAAMPDPMHAFLREVGWKMFLEVRSVFFDSRTFAAWKLPQPLTLVVGERSPAASKAMIKGLAAVSPQARVVELPRSGHLTLLTAPERFRPLIDAHRAQLRGARPARPR